MRLHSERARNRSYCSILFVFLYVLCCLFLFHYCVSRFYSFLKLLSNKSVFWIFQVLKQNSSNEIEISFNLELILNQRFCVFFFLEITPWVDFFPDIFIHIQSIVLKVSREATVCDDLLLKSSFFLHYWTPFYLLVLIKRNSRFEWGLFKIM